MLLFFQCFFCTIAGLVIGIFLMHSKPDGILKINTSDPEKDVYSFELLIPLDDLKDRTKISLTVESQNNQSM